MGLPTPARYRRAVAAIYHFARTADDIADEGDLSAAARHAELARFSRALDAIECGDTPRDPPFPALAAAVRAHGLPLGPLRDLVSAFAQDVDVTRYPTFATLADYCRRSANPVGRLSFVINDMGATPAVVNLRLSQALAAYQTS